MAARDDFQCLYSDSDSDDEFFDALANEDKANRLHENDNSNQSCANVSHNRTSDVNKGAGDAQLIHEELDMHGDAKAGDGLLPENEDTQNEACSEERDGMSEKDSHKLEEVEQSQCESERSDEDITLQSAESVIPFSASDTPQTDDAQHRSGEDGSIHEGLRAEENEEESQEELKDQGKEDEEVEGEIDEEQVRREREDELTEEEREKLKDEAQEHKARGNDLFKQNEFLDAISAYSQSLEMCPLCYKKERSIMYANRAACRIRKEQYEKAIADCNKALELHPHYLKVWLRRANTYEVMEKLDDALADFQKVLEMDPGCHEARAACMRLPDQIKERNEKLKEEMFGKLKDLGNMVLRPFGLSTNNFQLQQDPSTGSYSVNFQQNAAPGNGK